ncbi:MAG: hypothetical protein R3F43_19360 [bacterium]
MNPAWPAGFVHLPGLLDAAQVEAARADLDLLASTGAVLNDYGQFGS